MKHLLLVDIKNSSKIRPTKLWAVLNSLALRVNTKFNLAVPMVITLGDEVQMVCQRKEQTFEVLEFIQKHLKDIEFRAVVTAYDKNTKPISSLKLFEEKMNQTKINPLISHKFIKAHKVLDQKLDGIVLL